MLAMPPSSMQLRDFIVASRYARDGANGLETWHDATARVAAMHKRRWPELAGDIDQAFASVARGFVAPSMRSMQFGGLAAEVNNARMYNCAASPCDRTDFFAEYFWLLLCGAGCGFSVERRFVEKLPRLRDKVEYAAKQMGYRYDIEDSIEGWADAVKALFESYTLPRAPYVSFWYDNIRPKGSPIVTGGGLAPGPEPLREALEAVEDMLRRRLGQTLRPIDCYDICMKLSRAVLSGGIRRSASICLFDIDDDDMMQAKTGDWYASAPWRAYSNNSAVVPATAKRSQFAGILKASREYGDPGFFFQQSPTHLTNPCVTGDTWVHTDTGPRQIRNIAPGEGFRAIVDGKVYQAKGLCSRGTKPVLRIETKRGSILSLTHNHQIMTPDRGWVGAGSLTTGDPVQMHKHVNPVLWEGRGTWAEGWLLGSLYGDGNFSQGRAWLKFYGDDRWERLGFAKALLDTAFGEAPQRSGSSKGSYDDITDQRTIISSLSLASLAASYGMTPGNKFPDERLEAASSNFQRGFLSGWFDADGCASLMGHNSPTAILTCVDQSALQTANRMLLRFGVFGNIRHRRDAGKRMLPDGKGSYAAYDCQDLYEMHIRKDNLNRFVQYVGFTKCDKQQRLADMLETRSRTFEESFVDTVVRVDSIGSQEVFDVQVDTVHAFDANGFYVHNCCEIALEPFIDGVSGWQCCNLSAVAGTYLTKETFPQAVETAAFIGTLQAAYTDFAYLGPVSEAITRRDALLGVSISGFMDQPSWLFDPAVLRNGAAHAIAANQLWAKRLDIASASRVTTTKPAGTESLVFGSASGIHARPGRRYLRRVQCAADDAVAQAYAAANPLAVERSVYNANTIVLTFPIEAPEHSIVADDVTAPAFLQRVLDVQRNWVDPGTVRGSLRHAVSNTCIVRDNEWDIVSDMLWKNRTELAAVSLLAYDGASRHAQAPQEVCRTPEQHEWWEELRQAQRPVDYHSATANAVTAEPACAGGHCEL